MPHRVQLPDGSEVDIAPTPAAREATPAAAAGQPVDRAVPDAGPTVSTPLGRVFGARSGDKGGDANVGIWATSDAGYGWLRDHLDVEALQLLLPETAPLEVERHCLPNLRAVNFLVRGLLGEGVASSTRPDAQAKGLGEWLRARRVDLPVTLVARDGRDVGADSRLS